MTLYVVHAPQAGFLPQATFQTPPRDGHPCCSANGCYCQAIIHAKRTIHPWTSPWYSALRVNKKSNFYNMVVSQKLTI